MLGVAMAWELADRPDQALDVLDRLLNGAAGEAGPAALEHLSILADRLHMAERARSARERLVREYPESIEAARATPAITASAASGTGPVIVQIGVFSNLARARSLAATAQRSGFPSAEVVIRGQGRALNYVVSLGSYPNAEQAWRAGERAAKELGVSYAIVGRP
jgi:hypothetical protein